jgi:hypothetical protein
MRDLASGVIVDARRDHLDAVAARRAAIVIA